MNGFDLGAGLELPEAPAWEFQGSKEPPPGTLYITTDEWSNIQLDSGKRYFVDYDMSSMPIEKMAMMPFEAIRNNFIEELRDMGHEVENVKIDFPATTVFRIYFTITNPALVFWIIIAIGLAIGIAYGLGAAGTGIYYLFMGIGAALAAIVNLPEKIVTDVVKNPIATIAVLVAVGIFVLGWKA